MTTLDASNLVLKDVHHLFKLEREINNSFTSLLSLEPLTDSERQDLEEIRLIFEDYYEEGKILEGQIKLLLLSPLMWLSGFYHPSIRITLEEGIATIHLEDEDTVVKGRMDILAATKIQPETRAVSLWILLIECKNSSIDALEGLPQLLAYAYTKLEQQESVWGVTTNGKNYQFVYIQQGNPPTYQLLPELNLIRPEQAVELLRVLKAIRKLYVM